jgi:hypothetical protein
MEQWSKLMPTDTDRDRAIDAHVAELNRIRDQHGDAAAREAMALQQLALIFWMDQTFGPGVARRFLHGVLASVCVADRDSNNSRWRQQAAFALAHPNRLNQWERDFLGSMLLHQAGTPSARQLQTIGSIYRKAAQQPPPPTPPPASAHRRRLRYARREDNNNVGQS